MARCCSWGGGGGGSGGGGGGGGCWGCRSGSGGALEGEGALHTVALALGQMQDCMRSMRCKMDRTDRAVRCVTQRLKVQRRIIQKVDRRINVLEQGPGERGAACCPTGWCLAAGCPPSPASSSPDASSPLCPLARPPCPRRARALALASPCCCSYGQACCCAHSLPPPRRRRRPRHLPPACSRTQSSVCVCASDASSTDSCAASSPPDDMCSPQPYGSPCARRRSRSLDVCGALEDPCVGGGLASMTVLGRRLMKAAQKGHARRVRALLERGADVNFEAAGKWSPLHRAAAKAHACVVQLLLDAGANANARNMYGFTALHIAAYDDFRGRCLQLLINNGADHGSRNRFGRTPLHYAAECSNIAAVRVLLRAGASKTAKDDDGKSPLDVARTVCVRRLLRPAVKRRPRARSRSPKKSPQQPPCDGA